MLEEIAHRLRTVFADVLPPGQQPPATVVGSALSAGLHDPDVRRLLAVWLEVAALAARGDAVFSSAARAVVKDWVAWVGERIDVPDEQRRSAAAGVLVIVDGLVLFGAAGADEEGAAGATWLLDALTSTGPA
ncbi:MAG TPA: hypothetical protein VJ649_00410 [Actinomycetes bacterium]|nr:hypothetical protein [Actinomycetes bacterium]